MISRSSSFSISCVVGTNLAVNTKKLLKYARPGIVRPGTPSCAAAKHLQFLQAQCLNCIGEGFRGVFPRPPFLLMKNDAIFVIAGVGCVAARRRSRPSDIHLAGGAAKVQKRRTTFSCSSPSPTGQRTKETVGRWQCLMKYECPPCPSRSDERSRRSRQAAPHGHCVPPIPRGAPPRVRKGQA